jgi:hypothetical protein
MSEHTIVNSSGNHTADYFAIVAMSIISIFTSVFGDYVIGLTVISKIISIASGSISIILALPLIPERLKAFVKYFKR